MKKFLACPLKCIECISDNICLSCKDMPHRFNKTPACECEPGFFEYYDSTC